MSLLAGNESNAYTPPELFAGDAEVITNAHLFASGLTLAINSIVARNASGELVEWVPGASNGTEVAVGITCEAVDTSGGAAINPIYEGGYFNTNALNWPDGTTDAQKKGAFTGTNIHHRTLGYSG
ncbi:hypothetical protein [Marinobacter phage PS6]|uniref:head decoration protein n=1 Tax=Marinobacter sp. DS40M6 TaxID=1597776 RepID=UPI000C0C36F6|nr:head decoration protein [Marinobacter sp. DS40M6]ATN93249.1 hypothetical protein [Marinobacter phage PS6]MDC8457828.1 head decoration protein [Marinobacter sp. DS40M6]